MWRGERVPRATPGCHSPLLEPWLWCFPGQELLGGAGGMAPGGTWGKRTVLPPKMPRQGGFSPLTPFPCTAALLLVAV